MAKSNADAMKAGLLVAVGVLALLFAGRVVSLTAWWLSRAISGGIMILLAAVLGYAAYEIVAGWTAANETSDSDLDKSVLGEDMMFDTDSDESVESHESSAPVTDKELEEELDALIEDTETTNRDLTREVE